MPRFEKSPQWLVELFDAQIADLPAERRLMFGCPVAFARGQLACGLFEDSLLVRLPEEERARLLAVDGARVFDPMGGRPMKEYVLLPPDMLEDEEAVHGWMVKAVDYASALPPKKAKAKGKNKALAGRRSVAAKGERAAKKPPLPGRGRGKASR